MVSNKLIKIQFIFKNKTTCRYLELIHPIWHKTHFKKHFIFIDLIVNCLISITFESSHNIASAKVRLYDILWY